MPVTITNIKAIQTIIASRRLIEIDGVIGPVTNAAISQLRPVEREVVASAASMLQVDLDFNSSRRTVLLIEIELVASEVSRLTAVPYSYILQTVDMENFRTSLGDDFVVNTTGKYRGLGQFDIRTWTAVMPDVPYNDVGKTYESILAIARLYESNKHTFMVQGHDPELYSDGIAYLYHNQGAHSANLYLSSGSLKYPHQSLKAVSLFRQARGVYESSTV